MSSELPNNIIPKARKAPSKLIRTKCAHKSCTSCSQFPDFIRITGQKLQKSKITQSTIIKSPPLEIQAITPTELPPIHNWYDSLNGKPSQTKREKEDNQLQAAYNILRRKNNEKYRPHASLPRKLPDWLNIHSSHV